MCLHRMRGASRSGCATLRGLSLTALILAGAIALGGCISVRAPGSVVVGGRQPDPVDSGRVPQITTVEQGRAELDKAYQNLRVMEDENRKLARENAKLQRERDEYKSEAKRK